MKTINEGNIDIQKFPASKVHQLVKKMESSKVMAKHIRQVAGDILAAQVQLMQHQHTQLPARNYPRRKSNSTSGWKPQNHKTQEVPMAWKPPNTLRPDAHSDKCNRCGDTPHAKGFQCPARKFQCKSAINLATSHQYVSRKAKANTLLFPFKQGNQRHNNYVWGPFTPSMMQRAVNMNQGWKIPSVYK